MKRTQRMRAGVTGFTLIELMITVAVIAILAAIAMASYNWAMVKSRRAAAVTCLQQGAQFMERYYTTNMSYKDATVPTTCDGVSATFYTVSGGTPTASAFTITATPTSKQNDTLCGTLTINQQGVRTASGTAASSPAQCW
ncbi:type IV pilin protein [Pseudoxanthomonas sp.]|uniref:type IV pilin protein n=1 Tax=Pseudoxanthomonas sp. TaxID=1871049 RepID=UPI00262DD970|nr:type IV pilin protein [Pseudoxanthomonas sp.]WDS37474.1 MAG: type IV pilin protein [Pseudoxanthomonas sp.]